MFGLEALNSYNDYYREETTPIIYHTPNYSHNSLPTPPIPQEKEK